ncbi:MAG TPA: type II secretion system protein GspE [Firmicutes bacterium]|nr:type II secretion system protein GspE [Bacillota bacterium]
MNLPTMLEEIDVQLVKEFPREILLAHRLLPVQRFEEKIILVSDQFPPLSVIDDLAVFSAERLHIELVATELLTPLLNEYLQAPLDTVEAMITDLGEGNLDDYVNIEIDKQVENLAELAAEAPIIRMVNAIITSGLKQGASDIHIEPFEERMKIRYRIDGILYEQTAPPKTVLSAIITRIKITANLDIAEHRLPQDGRIRIRVLGRELDIRVSIMPTLYGESAVLRLLDRAAVLLDLKNLGFQTEVLTAYQCLLKTPHGIILVTGPTGSGKTTTLYATLNYLNSPAKKIMTIEDPVEYQLTGVNQIQVKPEIDFTFARGLRSILRQDPDIIMIGEIRDAETARIAVQAALTGHLVFATLHTNDAYSAVTRLLEMGVEDYLLASTLRGVLAQRLVRVLCLNCRQSYRPSQEELKKLGLLSRTETELFHFQGCVDCRWSGFSGRTGLYELLPIDKELQVFITRAAQLDQMKKVAREKGFRTMLEDGWDKVKAGITTVDEVMRVTSD